MPGTATIHQYNQAFLKELERLNPAQREAVDQIEGPVLVIAGPGTGKTHILAARIGRILLETDTQPHNILCLTFTDAGVQAMRRRLLELIGPEAHRVHISTFHSFCNNVIQDNLELFGRRDLEPLSELERVEIIRRLIDELPLRHPLKQGRLDAYYYESHLQDLFRRMKTENWEVNFVQQKIDEYLESLPAREEFIYKRTQGTFRKGELKQAKLDDAKEKMMRLRAAAELFPRYQKLMHELRRYDYEDMILWVLRAFREHPALLRNYQERYLYFLVDEYQDTNGAQNEVLQRLVEFWDSPNLFIVGDDDQSIYEFQGARLKNIVEFYANYQSDLKLVVLKENYRSSQHILDASGALIVRNELRIINNLKDLGIEKILTARHAQFSKTSLRPAVAEYPNRLHEEAAIVSQVEKLMSEGFPLDEVAIIYARHRQSQRLMELLEKKEIPYRTRRPVNILDLPLVQNLRTLLEYLQSEFQKPYSGDHLLFRIMHFDFLKISPQDLARLATCLSPGGERWTADEEIVTDAPKPKRRWREAISDEKFLKKCSLKNPAAMLELSAFLEFMLGEQANLSAPAFIERVINRSGLLRQVLGISDFVPIAIGTKSEIRIPIAIGTKSQIPNPQSLPVLHTLMGFVKKEAARTPRLTLSRLLEIFKSMDANRLTIELSVDSWQPTGGKKAIKHQPPAVNSQQSEVGSRQRVNLLTAHGSKGLEFQKVFLLDCVKDAWEPGRAGGNFKFTFPDTLTLSGEEDALESRRRLFYVAMTRAKEQLQISYASQDEEGKELQRVIFIDEMLKDSGIEVQPAEATPEALFEAQAALLLESKPAVAAASEELVAALLENFALSVTTLNKYLRCPLSFYYENVLGVPVVASEAATFGTALHNALRRGFEKMLRSAQTPFPMAVGSQGEIVPQPRRFPPTAEFVQFFEVEMQKLQGFFSRKEFERHLATGRQYLHDFVLKNAARWSKNVLVEQEFRNVEVEGVPLTGAIDRLDLLENSQTHLVDYKTGSQDAAKLRKPKQLAVGSKQLAELVPKYRDGNGQLKERGELPTANSELPTDLGGNYWRQLVFYKILYENWRSNPRRVVSAEISYLEPDTRGEFPQKTLSFEPGDVAFVKNLIKETYEKIMRHEFYEGCGLPECTWCSFLLRQEKVDSFAEKSIEELDD